MRHFKEGAIGSYAELHLGPLYVGGDKREINPLVMLLFRASDKRVYVSEPHPTGEERAYREPSGPGDAHEEPYEVVEYVAPASAVRNRLELMGFTLQATRRAFEVAVQAEQQAHAVFTSTVMLAPVSEFVEDAAVLAGLSVEQWMAGLREIRDRGLAPTSRRDPQLAPFSPLLRYMLGGHLDGWYGFPSADVRHVIRLAVEVSPEDDLVYDLTELVRGGYSDSTDDLIGHADALITADFETTRRVVVLTEGATDQWILERSLRVLYPHLANYYTFMDFGGARVAGGAGALAGMVKAFVGAGILNRVVALFDNDTAGAAALGTLTPIRMPPNIVALQYPPLRLARQYPTVGPGGRAEMDVNGLAGSIELYLGPDVLSDGGELAPVHWKGYDEKLRRYQGEVVGKRDILERFERKLAA
ncbi:MAG TPA: HEPN/Toprim-associated domain-containing protein, partial [Gemmatirosa sp.]